MGIRNKNIKNGNGISYSKEVDSSADWSGVTNSTYFKDLSDSLIYYKNSGGTVISIFEEGGSDTFVTGGTYTSSASTITLDRNDGNSVSISGITSGGGTPALNNGEIFVGNASDAATSVPMSGDTTISNTGVVTIGSDKVTYDKMQDTTQAALLGNQAGSGTISEIPIVEQYIPAGTNRTLLNTSSNWNINGTYTGATISGTYQGQSHYNDDYWFTAVDDNVWIRLIRG